MDNDQRGLRLKFSADAEVQVQDSTTSLRGRVTELSLRGCFLEISGSFKDQERVRVKILCPSEYFESLADVIYVRPPGVGLLFVEMKPHFRTVLQRWILSALDHQIEETPAR
jgi:hypothetical protein